MKKIDTVITFCTYDLKYINRTIESIKNISSNVYITYCTNLFNGDPENMDLIQSVKDQNKDCIFIKFDYDKYKNIRWHHNYGRWIATALSNADYIFYIDSDEVFDSDRLKQWIDSKESFADVSTFANYWYFRSEKYQAKTHEDSPILIKRSLINQDTSFHDLERGYYKHVMQNSSKEISILGLDNLPMCHHYSWALDKEDMLCKVKNWGHKHDKDWITLIEEEFSREFNGKDFIHNYEYNILS